MSTPSITPIVGADEWFHHDRAEVLTLEQVRVILGERYEDFAADLVVGDVPSTLALMTPGQVRPIAVTAGAVADWLHPLTLSPGDSRSKAPRRPHDVPGEAGRVLDHLRADVVQWQERDRIDDGVAADLGHYLQQLHAVVEALEDAAP